MKISDKLYALRVKEQLTQVDLGEIAGVSNRAVSNWERGTKVPKVRPLRQICSKYSLDINLFVNEDTTLEECYFNSGSPVVELDEAALMEAELIRLFSKLSREDQERELVYLRSRVNGVGK